VTKKEQSRPTDANILHTSDAESAPLDETLILRSKKSTPQEPKEEPLQSLKKGNKQQLQQEEKQAIKQEIQEAPKNQSRQEISQESQSLKARQNESIKATPLFKAQQSVVLTTEQLVSTKLNTIEVKTPKQKADETLKLLLHGKKEAKKEAGLTPDFSVATAKVIAPTPTTHKSQDLASLLHAKREDTEA